jgi:hypothetical protein
LVACVECLRAGADRLERLDPEVLHGDVELVAIAGGCVDILHRLPAVCDDLLPRFTHDVKAGPTRVALRATAVVGGLVLAGGAAYGVVPGELGHHGAVVIDTPGSHAKSAVERLAEVYGGRRDEVVLVDGGTESVGPAIVSAARPARDVSVLATRDVDGSCAFLRGRASVTKVATTPPGSRCLADAPPRRGWSFTTAYGTKRP